MCVLGVDFSAKNRQVGVVGWSHNEGMHKNEVALVTGANKGIGLQIAKDLAARGLTVLVGSRNLEHGETAAKAVGSGARAIQLDVTKEASVRAAAERVKAELGRLDVLVNNAGISHSGELDGLSFEEMLAKALPSNVPMAEVRACFETNVFGVIAVTQAFLPLLREAPVGRIVNVSSSVGSLALQSDPSDPIPIRSVSYIPTKTALNSVTIQFAKELAKTRIKVNAMCPGFVATDLNAFRGTRTVQQGAREAVRLALIGADGPTGTYSNDEGPLPW